MIHNPFSQPTSKKPKYKESGVKKQFPPLDPNKTKLGASGGIGIIGGANLISAGKQILKSGIGKGALNFVKGLLKKKIKPQPFGKPVNYSGPNPMHKTGAGGRSYPG